MHFILPGSGSALSRRATQLFLENSDSLRAVAMQIFVNFRLWMVAESPFSKQTVGAAA